MLNLNSFKAVSLLLLASLFTSYYFYDLALIVEASVFYAFFGITVIYVLMVFSYFKFGSLINPVSLLLPLLLGFYYYGFYLSEKQAKLSWVTIAAVACFIIFYIIGTLLRVASIERLANSISQNTLNLGGVLIVYVVGWVVFFLECIINGGLPLYALLVLKQDVYSELKFIPMLHYFVMLHALIPAILYFAKRKGYLSTFWFCVLSFGSFFILFNNLSRQIIILCVLCLFFVYVTANSLRADSMLIKGLFLFALIFFGLGQIRVAAINDDISATEYLKIYSDVPQNYDINLFDVTFNLYASINFSTLNEIIESTQGENGYGYGKFMLKPIITISGADKAFQLDYIPMQDSFLRLGTIVADPYLDFGLLGVVILSFLYGVFSAQLFRLFSSCNNLGVTLVWSINVFLMVMAVFTNFYNLLFIWACIAFGFYVSGIFALKNFRLALN